MIDGPTRETLLEAMADAALRAGAAILDIYATDFTVLSKADESPVTQADEAAEAIILAALARAAPGVPVVAEEEMAAGRCPDTDSCFFLVDPLDGTREFVARRGDFTVNIALIEAHRPSLGVVYAPAADLLFAGDVAAGQAWRRDGSAPRMPIAVRQAPADGLTVVASRSHGSSVTDDYLATLPVAERIARGSSLKICLVAAGAADLYPRPGPTYEWDIAAGDAVLRGAGGRLLDIDGADMPYGKPRFWNPGFIAVGAGFAPPPLRPWTTDRKDPA